MSALRTFPLGIARASLLLALCASAGCDAEEAQAPAVATSVPAVVRAVVDRRCTGCHGPYDAGTYDLTTDASLLAGALQVGDSVASGRMPRWMPDAGCGTFADPRRLTDAERDLLVDWAAGVDVADRQVTPPDRVLAWPDRPPDLTLTMEGPFNMQPSEQLDRIACHSLLRTFDHDLFVEAVRFRPNRPELVHHLGLIAIPPENFRHVGSTANPEIFCAEDAALPVASTLELTRPVTYPEGVAARIPAGWSPALSVHYSQAFAPAGETSASVTFEVDLWLAEPTAVTDFSVDNYGVESLLLPAGAESTIVTSEHLITSDRTAIALAPHMHLFGRSYRAELHRKTGEVECLVGISNWRFDDQEFYFFDPAAPLQLYEGDRIRFSCEYDDSAAGQPRFQGRVEEPRDVSLGWTSRDEMCNLTFLEVGQR